MKRILIFLFAAMTLLFSDQAYATVPATGNVSINIPSLEEIDAEILLDSLVATPVITRSIETDRDYDSYSYRKQNWVRPLTQMIIAVVAILAFPAFVIIIICVLLRSKRRMLLDKYQVIENAMRMGVTLPEAFFLTNTTRFNDYRRLRSALIWMACGLSMILFGGIVGTEEMVGIGVLPLLIGVAKLVVYVIARRDNNQTKTWSDNNVDQI